MKKFFGLLLIMVGLCIHVHAQLLTTSTSILLKSSVLNRQLALEDSIQSLYDAIELKRHGLKYEVFRYGVMGYLSLRREGRLNDKAIITLIDFTQSSRKKRFFTIDLDARKILFNTYVSHGKNTGGDMATHFSDTPHSNQSSLGFYVTGETYVGSKGYSLRLDGVEEGFNGNMRDRAVVMHKADYVSETWIRKYGRLGRSQGCPALPVELSRAVIDTIKDRTAIFAYYNDEHYLRSSHYVATNKLFAEADEATESINY